MKALIIKTVCMFALVALVAGNSWSQNAEQLYQKGIMKEEGEGSLKEAIDLYKSVADNTNADKVLRAKALYQMGNCYEKLGQQEARNVYEKLVANYIDPADLVANAKRKLNNLNVGQPVLPKSGLSLSLIKDASINEGPYSPDGKYVVYYDWDSISLGVRNLQTREKWIVSKKGKWGPPVDQYPDVVIWSPDSKSLAYCWTIHDKSYSKYSAEIHLVERDGSEDRIIGKDTVYFIPQDWSSDGRNLLCARWGNSVTLSLVTTKDGKEKEIVSLGRNRFPLGTQFSDDGNFVIFSAPNEEFIEENEDTSENYDIYIVPINGGAIQELVSFKEKEEGPWVIQESNKVVFISSHSGEKDLWAINIENGKLKGEPEILKTGLDVTSQINSVLDNGTVMISSNRLNTEFFYAKLDFERNDVTYFPFDIARDASIKMVKTIWSPSLNKMAVLAADPMLQNGFIKMKIIGYDLRTRDKQELPTTLYTFPEMDWINPQWTPDEKSVLIKAQPIKMHPRGIFKFEFSTQNTSEYMMEDSTWSGFKWKWRWLQFSPNGLTQYFASTDDNSIYPTKLIARSVEAGNEKIIKQFDKESGKFFLSPDGNLIAVKYDNSLQVFDTDGFNEKIILKDLGKNWGTMLGWSADSKSLFIQKPVGKESWSIRSVSLDGQESGDLISPDKLKPFLGASNLLMHYVNGNTYLSMQNGKRIYELWTVENIARK